MSVPAPSLPGPHHRHRDHVARPARLPAARPNPAPPPPRRARRGSTPAFWVFSGVLVAGLVMGVVSLNALVVNTTYRTIDVERRVRVLQREHEELDIEVARLSSPSRIAAWADAVGLVVPGPGESVILRVPGDRSER